ncbi:MAG TPA: ferredoxin [Acidimicrobiales bacterium]|nr:ferredoxin [Acidimicrobiales bacterium]
MERPMMESTDAASDRIVFTVSVDNERCQGHARCWQLLPEFFTLDDEGYSNIGDNQPVTAEQEAKVRQAVNACPELAFTIHERKTD